MTTFTERQRAMQRASFHESLKVHCLHPHQGFALPVMLLASKNEYIDYPVKGVLLVFEQGTDLGISQAVFHERKSNGALGAPCTVNNPKFVYLERE